MRAVVEYPCPLGNGDYAYLRLPSDFSLRDYARIVRVLRTLAPGAPEDTCVAVHASTGSACEHPRGHVGPHEAECLEGRAWWLDPQ